MNFLKNFKISQLNCGTTEGFDGVGGGSVTSTSNPVDMTGYEGVVFIANIVKVCSDTSGANLYVSYSCSSGGTFHAIAGSAIQCGSSDTNFYLASEIVKPLPEQRWLAGTVVVTASCDWVGAISAIQYGPHAFPVTQPTCCYTDMNISATSGTI
jgi:hypothetical protein